MTPHEPQAGSVVRDDPERPARPVRPGDLAPGRVTPGRATKPQARVVGIVPVVAAFAIIGVALQTLDEIYEAVKSGGAADTIDRPLQAWMVEHRHAALDVAQEHRRDHEGAATR